MTEILVKIKTNDRPTGAGRGLWLKLIIALLGVLAAVTYLVTAYLKTQH